MKEIKCRLISDDIKLNEDFNKLKVRCKCGHNQYIPLEKEKMICSWCGCYVFKNKKDEFKYRLNNLIKKNIVNNKNVCYNNIK
jgi:hypothetical protein